MSLTKTLTEREKRTRFHWPNGPKTSLFTRRNENPSMTMKNFWIINSKRLIAIKRFNFTYIFVFIQPSLNLILSLFIRYFMIHSWFFIHWLRIILVDEYYNQKSLRCQLGRVVAMRYLFRLVPFLEGDYPGKLTQKEKKSEEEFSEHLDCLCE